MSCFNVPGDMALNEDETDCVLVESAEGVLQAIKVGVQIFAGSYYFDRSKGIRYVEDVFVKNPDLRIVRIAFWEFFSSVPGVSEVVSVNLKVDAPTRTLYVDFVVRADGVQISDQVALRFPNPTE